MSAAFQKCSAHLAPKQANCDNSLRHRRDRQTSAELRQWFSTTAAHRALGTTGVRMLAGFGAHLSHTQHPQIGEQKGKLGRRSVHPFGSKATPSMTPLPGLRNKFRRGKNVRWPLATVLPMPPSTIPVGLAGSESKLINRAREVDFPPKILGRGIGHELGWHKWVCASATPPTPKMIDVCGSQARHSPAGNPKSH